MFPNRHADSILHPTPPDQHLNEQRCAGLSLGLHPARRPAPVAYHLLARQVDNPEGGFPVDFLRTGDETQGRSRGSNYPRASDLHDRLGRNRTAACSSATTSTGANAQLSRGDSRSLGWFMPDVFKLKPVPAQQLSRGRHDRHLGSAISRRPLGRGPGVDAGP